jgi:hypothetical protein
MTIDKELKEKLNKYPKDYVLMAIDKKLSNEFMSRVAVDIAMLTLEQLVALKEQLLEVNGKKDSGYIGINRRGGGGSQRG